MIVHDDTSINSMHANGVVRRSRRRGGLAPLATWPMASLRRSQHKGRPGYAQLLSQLVTSPDTVDCVSMYQLVKGPDTGADLNDLLEAERVGFDDLLCEDHLKVELSMPPGQLDASIAKLIDSSGQQVRNSITVGMVTCIAMCHGYTLTHDNSSVTKHQAIMCWQILERLEAVQHKYSGSFSALIHTRSVEGYMYATGLEHPPTPRVLDDFLALAVATPTKLTHLTPDVFIYPGIATGCMSYIPASSGVTGEGSHSSTDIHPSNA